MYVYVCVCGCICVRLCVCKFASVCVRMCVYAYVVRYLSSSGFDRMFRTIFRRSFTPVLYCMVII